MRFEFKSRLLHPRRQRYPTQQAPYDARSIGGKLRRSGASGFLLMVPVLSLNSNDVPNFEISIVSFILSDTDRIFRGPNLPASALGGTEDCVLTQSRENRADALRSRKSTNERSQVFQQAFERGGRSKRFRI
jgi:hypothetical protein